MNNLLPLVIIGPGKVGTALGVLAHRCGYPIAAIGGRDLARTWEAAWQMGNPHVCTPQEAARLGSLVMLTVSDSAIASVCQEIASAGAFAPGAVVVHCSGALDSTVLQPAKEQGGCAVASLHPLQTFPTVDDAVSGLPGAYWFAEGDEASLPVVERFATALGASQVVRLAPGSKAAYHASAVLACNALVGLLDAALAAAEQAGISRKQAAVALRPLVHTTLAK